MRITTLLLVMLVGCAEAHTFPVTDDAATATDDAGVLCPEPHEDCFAFLTEEDRAIPWQPRTDCTERPEREHYAMRPIWPEPEGTPCGNGGTCGQWGVCE